MKVVHLLPTNRFSGAENVVCQIIGIMKRDTDIDMVYCSRWTKPVSTNSLRSNMYGNRHKYGKYFLFSRV